MPRKVLVADDSLTIQKVIELTFSEENYEVVAFSNGKDALEYLRGERADILLADVVMPELNGYELCREAKALYPELPVILLTGTFEPFDKQKAMEVKSDDTVIKPFDSQALIQKVEELISKAPPVQEMPPETKEEFVPEKPPAFLEESKPSFTEEPPLEGLLPEEPIEGKIEEKFPEETPLADISAPSGLFEGAPSQEPILEESPPFPQEALKEEAKEEFAFLQEKVQEEVAPEKIFEEKGEEIPFEVPKEEIPAVEKMEEEIFMEKKEEVPLMEEKVETPFMEQKEETPFIEEKVEMPVEREVEVPDEVYQPPSLAQEEVPYEEPPSYEQATIPFEEKEGKIEELEEKPIFEERAEEKILEVEKERHLYEEKVEEKPVFEEKAEVPIYEEKPAFEEKAEVPLYEERKEEEKVEPAKAEEKVVEFKPPVAVQQIELSKAQIEEIAKKVVEYLSDEVVKQIAWEVVPELAELYIKQKIKELEEE